MKPHLYVIAGRPVAERRRPPEKGAFCYLCFWSLVGFMALAAWWLA
jgi:hypothetical protein